MRCYICDVAIAEPKFNADHGDYEPCDYCQSIVQDTLDGYLDQPSAADDDFGEDVLKELERYYVETDD